MTWSVTTAALLLVIAVAAVLGATIPMSASTPSPKASAAAPLVREAYALGGSGLAAGFSVAGINAWGGSTYNLLSQASQVRIDEGAGPTDPLLLAVSSASGYAADAAAASSTSQAAAARTATLNAVFQAVQALSGRYVPVPGPVADPMGGAPSPTAPKAPRPVPVPTPPMPDNPPLPGPKG